MTPLFYLYLRTLIGVFPWNDWIFKWVCDITLVVKYIIRHLDALAELCDFIHTLVGRVKPLDKYMFLKLSGWFKLNNIDNFRRLEVPHSVLNGRKLSKLSKISFMAENKLACFGSLGA